MCVIFLSYIGKQTPSCFLYSVYTACSTLKQLCLLYFHYVKSLFYLSLNYQFTVVIGEFKMYHSKILQMHLLLLHRPGVIQTSSTGILILSQHYHSLLFYRIPFYFFSLFETCRNLSISYCYV